VRGNKEPIPEYLDAMQPDAPEPEAPDSPTWRAVKKGTKWGSIVGFVISQIYIGANSIATPFGSIYGGNMLVVFAFWIGIGSALGALIGWASVTGDDSDDDMRPAT
jgi:hypothetical protein